MNTVQTFFSMLKLSVGPSSYCSECTTASGLPGAKFCSNCACRQGYGCSPAGGGSMAVRSRGNTKKMSSSYTQVQLNGMASTIADLTTAYNNASTNYSNKVAAWQALRVWENCHEGASLHCDPGHHIVGYTCSDGEHCSDAVEAGRGQLATARQQMDSAETAMKTAKGLLKSASDSYSDAVASFEKEKKANMTPEERAAYENSLLTSATKNNLRKYGGYAAIAVGTALVLFFGYKKIFKKGMAVAK